SSRAARIPARYDLSLPANQAKLDAVERLTAIADGAGLSLIHLAIAFVLRHPTVTAPIIGPRTMEQLESQLGAAEVVLTTDVLEALDAVAPPGTTVNAADAGWRPSHLDDPAERRRPPAA